MKIRTNEDKDGSKSIYYYDDNDNKIRSEDYDEDGDLLMAAEYFHNNSGQCTGWILTDAKGNQFKRFVVKFDEAGWEIETLQYDHAGQLELRHAPDT